MFNDDDEAVLDVEEEADEDEDVDEDEDEEDLLLSEDAVLLDKRCVARDGGC